MSRTFRMCKAGLLAAAMCWCAPLVVQAQALNVRVPIASNCPPGYHWEMALGYAVCAADAPPVPLPPPDPPPPACTYQAARTYISVGDAGQCTADGGCEGLGYEIRMNGARVGGNAWLYQYMDDNTLLARVDQDMATRFPAYRRGAYAAQMSPGNGNMRGTRSYQLCTG